MLKPFGDDIWIADSADTVEVFGFRYPTRMAIVKLADGGLFIWSPIALAGGLRAEVEALGPVRHIVAPNSLHHLSLAEWQQAWPGAKLHAPPGLRDKRKDIAFDADLGDKPDADWAGEIDQVAMPGNAITTEIVFFHAKSGTVLFTDLIQHFPAGWFSGWRAIVAKLDLMTAPEPSVPRKFRLAFTGRRAARDAITRILAWPADKLLMAHGAPVTENGKAVIARAFGWLKK
ncbi:DUF4336 domain-containing protein [Parvibaculum sp.]|uniref:DUF4336 domain-containing protein n=1 Tax=Parvibaculum sp. TaxID=2024848 RepID=UPI002731DEDB|nr:DUF4336 domain-containing protein [Parvibaculum sp.]MDP1628532.1 DUF4336 domain-containing protein [Parvibaculum sp.]MDP2151864.1 DUF4336 domain-containing protein [Parvibaculum sp.]MDP3326987.1 DUF4336 domain-containing protein [Parvibaculum sp.]